MSEQRASVGGLATVAAGAVTGLAAALHRWFATTLAERLTDRMRTLDSLLD